MQESYLTWAEIDLDAIGHNVRAYQRHCGENVRLMAVVKANAYGHGAVPVARAALSAGAERLAVSRAIEGVELRKAGIQAPILLMGYTPPGGADLVAEWRLTPSLMTVEAAQALSQRAEALGYKIPVHVKVDTGMSRYGVLPGELIGLLNTISNLPGIEIEGLFTHFATADSADQTHMRAQLALFEQALAEARGAGFRVPIVHAANSAATMLLPEAHFDAVRIGIGMYGLDPSSEWAPVFPIRPALSLKSRVSRVRVLPAGAGVSYGRTYVAEEPVRAALISTGYGDGFHRALSNRGAVLIRGRRAPIIGRVCMDQFVVDASAIPQAAQDDEAVLIGEQGGERLRAEEVAALAGTINYEATTSLTARVVRVYLEKGQVVQVGSLGQA